MQPAWRVDGEVVLKYMRSSENDLASALNNIPKDKDLRHLFLGRLRNVESSSLQDDIYSYLNTKHSEELAEAFRSSGNMHNPALLPIRKNFDKALLESSFLKKLEFQLNKNSLKVSGVSFEKFFLIKEQERTLFDVVIWITVEPHLTRSMPNVLPKQARSSRPF